MERTFPSLARWLARSGTEAGKHTEAARIVRSRLPEVARRLRAEFGADRVILFGSLCSGGFDDGSDVDLAVSGLAPERYFEALARVAEILERQVDLVELERARPSLVRHVLESGEALSDG